MKMRTLYLNTIDYTDDKEKFEKLYIKYRSKMYYVAMSVLHDRYDAEDALHNAFIAVAKNINKIAEDNKNNNNIKIDKISLKDVIKNMANKNLSKSTYESLGMGEYYNLKSLMSLSQGITKYNQNNSAFSIAKAGISMSNFTIKV